MSFIILLAENNETILENYRVRLVQEGYIVVTAQTPPEAKMLLASGRIDLAIIDWRLEENLDENDQSGLELIRSYGDKIPAILMTYFERSSLEMTNVFRPEQTNACPIDFFSKSEETLDSLVNKIKQVLINRNVFIVHGHDRGMLDDVRDFITKQRLNPLVLQDLPANGRTIIENLEEYSNVNYVIALLTADDCGYSCSDGTDQLASRARQNVILELGLFIGKLGRERIATLVEKGVEIPSDLSGVTYISLDGDWRGKLAEEMHSAGAL